MKRRALITGISGQDGSYLAEFLLDKGYSVAGLVQTSPPDPCLLIRHIIDRVEIVHGDLTDQDSLDSLIAGLRPQEVYNLAAQSFVPASWKDPVSTIDITGTGVARLLEAVRRHSPESRFFQASSAELFGDAQETPQRETTPFRPRTPYGVAKLLAHHLTSTYREGHGMFACSGISFNHESPRRHPDFVTRKITRTAARIKLGLDRELRLGNLDAKRDWGFAGDYVRAEWMMLQHDRPEDFVIATGEPRTVGDFVRAAFGEVGLDWEKHVVVDPEFFRPAEANAPIGDPSKIRKELGWRPETSFADLVKMMVAEDLAGEAKENGLPVPGGEQIR